MPTKSVIVAILGLSLLVGAVVSGCNRNRDDSVASANSRRRSSKQHELSSVRNVRPAEVLSASAYRPPVRRKRTPPAAPNRQQYNNGYYNQQQQYGAPYSQPSFQPAPAYQVAQAYEPLPEPIPVSQLAVSPASFDNSGSSYYAPASYQQPAPATYQEPYYSSQGTNRNDPYAHLPEYAYKPQRRNSYAPPAPASAGRPQSPDLAMARARLEPPPVAPSGGYAPRMPAVQQMNPGAYNYNYNSNTQVPPVDPRQFAAPLPELEPVRYQRVANNPVNAAPRVVPQVPVLMSAAPKAQQPSQQQARPRSQQRRQQQVQQQQVAGYSYNRNEAEVERALAPLEQPRQQQASRDWVSSTAASMIW